MTSTAGEFPAGLDDAEIVRALRPRIRAMVCRYVRDPRDRDDLEQEVWLRYLRYRDTIHDPDRILAWLRRMVRNEAARLAARRRRELAAPDPDDGRIAPPADRGLTRAVVRGLLWDEVDRLPERDRILITLIALHPELSHADLAARIGVAPGSIGPLRARCLTMLRRRLRASGITHARL